MWRQSNALIVLSLRLDVCLEICYWNRSIFNRCAPALIAGSLRPLSVIPAKERVKESRQYPGSAGFLPALAPMDKTHPAAPFVVPAKEFVKKSRDRRRPRRRAWRARGPGKRETPP